MHKKETSAFAMLRRRFPSQVGKTKTLNALGIERQLLQLSLAGKAPHFKHMTLLASFQENV